MSEVVEQRGARVEGIGSAIGVRGQDGAAARLDRDKPGSEIAPVIVAERQVRNQLRAKLKNVFPEDPFGALVPTAECGSVGYRCFEEVVVAGAMHFPHLKARDQRLHPADGTRPLCAAPECLRRNMLVVGQSFGIALRYN